MKIVMDFRKYDGVIGGVEQGVIQVTRYMCRTGNQVVLVCKQNRLDEVQELFGETDGLKIVPVDVKTHVMGSENARLDAGFFQDLAVAEGASLIHFFYNWSFPSNKKVPSVLTIHDVIPFTFREAMGFFRNHFVYKPRIREACQLNDVIATVSEFSRQDIAKTVGVPLEKIHVVPNGLREPAEIDPAVKADLEKKFGLEDGFILNVGGIHERKNIPRLIQSFAALVKNQDFKGKLVITGSVSGPPYQEKMKKLCDAAVSNAGMDGRVIFTGFISEQELDNLLRDAELLIYPSLYEGFGIPILEAMKVGTPVVTSNVTAMPEVAGGAAALVDPLDTAAMTEAMSRIMQDDAYRAGLIEKGKARVLPYTWDAACECYIELYKQITAK